RGHGPPAADGSKAANERAGLRPLRDAGPVVEVTEAAASRDRLCWGTGDQRASWPLALRLNARSRRNRRSRRKIVAKMQGASARRVAGAVPTVLLPAVWWTSGDRNALRWVRGPNDF